jgi:lipoprotein LpqH
MGIAGCSSSPPRSPSLSAGALPAGTAEVTVNGNGAGPIYDVTCQDLGNGFISISIGRTATRTTVLVDASTPKGITFHHVEGFTGSYWQDLQGSARLGVLDQTYALTGTAVGLTAEKPYARTTNSFAVKVAC